VKSNNSVSRKPPILSRARYGKRSRDTKTESEITSGFEARLDRGPPCGKQDGPERL